jgi:hypothetical protein
MKSVQAVLASSFQLRETEEIEKRKSAFQVLWSGNDISIIDSP